MVERIPNDFGCHLDQSGMVANVAYHRAVKHAATQFAELLSEGGFRRLAACCVIAIPELNFKPNRLVRREFQPFPPVIHRFRGQAVLRSPRPHVRQMAEHTAPCGATASEFLAALEPPPKAHQLAKRGPIRDRKVESAGDPLAISGIAVPVRYVKVFVRRGVAFVLAKEFEAPHATHRAVEVGDFAGDLENERSFGNDCGGVVAKLGERVRITERLFQPLEFRAKPFGLAAPGG